MNQQDFMKAFEEAISIILDTVKRKNADYTGWEDAFKNFKLAENLWVTTTERAILVRLLDKVSRISSLLDVEKPQVENEKLEDTLLDLAAYAIILYVYIKNKGS